MALRLLVLLVDFEKQVCLMASGTSALGPIFIIVIVYSVAVIAFCSVSVAYFGRLEPCYCTFRCSGNE